MKTLWICIIYTLSSRKSYKYSYLYPNLGGLFKGPFLLGVGVKLCYKREIWYVSTQKYLASENIPRPS